MMMLMKDDDVDDDDDIIHQTVSHTIKNILLYTNITYVSMVSEGYFPYTSTKRLLCLVCGKTLAISSVPMLKMHRKFTLFISFFSLSSLWLLVHCFF